MRHNAPAAATATVADTARSPHARLRPVPVNAVTLRDAFWQPRREINRTATLPSQFRHLEETGRLDNFRRAAGKRPDLPFQGIFFNDSDVYKWLEAAASTLAADDDPALAAMVDTASPTSPRRRNPTATEHLLHVREGVRTLDQPARPARDVLCRAPVPGGRRPLPRDRRTPSPRCRAPLRRPSLRHVGPAGDGNVAPVRTGTRSGDGARRAVTGPPASGVISIRRGTSWTPAATSSWAAARTIRTTCRSATSPT
jgi:hypothetical protein